MTTPPPPIPFPATTSRPMARGGARSRSPWPALVVLCLANFLILLDTTVVNTAVPDIMTSLHTGLDSALWVLNGYLLAFASLLIACGRLGDVFGPRRVFVAGLAVFTLASAACALARDPAALVGARVVQGVGAAMLVPQALVLISAIFPAERRGAAFGVFTATAGIASISGPTLGGLLITESGWHFVFWLNLPIGAAGIIAALILVPDLRTGRSHRLDPVGVLLATLGLFAVVYGLIEGARLGAGRTVAVAGGLVSLGVFLLWERRHPEPLLPTAVLRVRNFSVAAVVTLLNSFVLYGFLLVYVLETQSALGMSPLRCGVLALALTVTLSALAPLAGRLADRIDGRRPLIAGAFVQALGVLGVAMAAHTATGVFGYAGPLALIGAGMGLSIAPTTTEAMRSIPPGQTGAASGVLNTARQVGAVLGATVVGTMVRNRAGALARSLGPRQGMLTAGRQTLYVVFGILICAGLVSLLLRRVGAGPSSGPVPRCDPDPGSDLLATPAPDIGPASDADPAHAADHAGRSVPPTARAIPVRPARRTAAAADQ